MLFTELIAGKRCDDLNRAAGSHLLANSLLQTQHERLQE